MNELALFAGVGGGILGGMLCGFKTVCAVEIDAFCREVLLRRQMDGCLPKFPIWDDVRTFDGRPWRGIVDIVTGGFPCQDISAAGKGAGITGERSGLWTEMARIIGEIRPRFCLVENSPLLVSRGLDRVLSDIASMGYDAQWGVIGAHHVGAPHRRERIWILAYADNCAGSAEHKCEQEMWAEQFGGVRENRESVVANAESTYDRCDLDKKMQRQVQQLGIGTFAEDVSNPNGTGFKKQCWSIADESEYEAIECGSWWESEPNVGRVANGVASRVERLKAIGNGQVPAVVRLAWDILSDE